MRPSKRKNNELRQVQIETGVLLNAHGSCLVKFGNTHVICSATLDQGVPPFLRGQNQGWVTAEYGMLPCATHDRTKREASQLKPSGRTLEIQRLISRSMRACVDLKALGERQILIDCDVINADGGTRTAAITGSYVALHLAISALMKRRLLRQNPLIAQIAAVSCGIFNDQPVVDLDYAEDSNAEVDANFVFTSDGKMIEVQATGEKAHFSADQLADMIKLAQKATSELFLLQNKVLLGI